MVFNLDQLDDYILAVKNLKGKFVSLDYEASGLNIFSKQSNKNNGFFLGGVGISDEIEGFYLAVNSLESRNELTTEQIDKIVDLYQWLESKKVILVYNQSYELNVTKRIFNYELKVQDVLVLATTLDTRGSLKDNSRKFLFGESVDSPVSLSSNDDDEESFVSEEFWEKNISLWNKHLRNVVKAYLPKNGKENKHFTSFLEQYAAMRESGQYQQPEHKIKGLNEGYANLFLVIEEELPPEDTQTTKEILFETIISKVHNSQFEIDFTYIPVQMVSKYCISDCINTVKLFKVFAQMLQQGNYKTAFDSYSKQTMFAMQLENNGIAWDEDAHQHYKSILQEHLLSRMKSMILNPRVVEALEITEEQILEIKTSSDISFLNTFINPRSIKTREIVTKVMMTKAVKIAWLLETAKDLIKKQSNYGRKALTKMDKFLGLPYGSAASLEDIIPDLGPVVYFYRESGKAFEKEFMSTQLDKFELPGFNKEVIAKFKDIFSRYFSIDFSSWESINSMEECRFYVDIFLCKKIAKEISGFDSKLGMDCVTPKEEISYPVKCDYLYRGRFNPCAVTTKRWSSQIHTLATNSSLRECLVSTHSEDGILFHTDLSQAEVRVSAMLSQETVLLENYRSGMDIHKINASKIFKKPIEEVTGTERSVAKAMTFGILYGKGSASFVEEGIFKNMEEADKAFADFYSAYPNLAAWMQAKREEVLANKFVYTGYGDIIHIPFEDGNERETAAAQRDAVNYPIQHYSSCSAGLTFKAVCEEYKAEGINAKGFAFTHDALDLDVHVKDFFKVLYTLQDKVNRLCYDLAGIEMSNDPGIGISFADAFEYKIIDENTFEFTGIEGNVRELCRRLSNHFDLEISYEDAGDSVINLRELFLKSAYSTFLDQPRKQVKAIVVRK